VKQLLVHEDAELEFKDAVDYYEARSIGLGLNFAAEMEKCYRAIRQAPTRFPFHKNTVLQRCVTRRFPYVIFFRDFGDHISIIAIAHGKRRPNYWKDRAST
jgi:toxin ParE1/3/4